MVTKKEVIEAMKATASPKPIKVDAVAAWGTLYVKPQTVAEVDEDTEDRTKDGKNMRLARAAARVICDEEGKRIFDPTNEEELILLSEQPWAMLQKVLEAVGGGASPAGKETPAGNS